MSLEELKALRNELINKKEECYFVDFKNGMECIKENISVRNIYTKEEVLKMVDTQGFIKKIEQFLAEYTRKLTLVYGEDFKQICIFSLFTPIYSEKIRKLKLENEDLNFDILQPFSEYLLPEYIALNFSFDISETEVYDSDKKDLVGMEVFEEDRKFDDEITGIVNYSEFVSAMNELGYTLNFLGSDSLPNKLEDFMKYVLDHECFVFTLYANFEDSKTKKKERR